MASELFDSGGCYSATLIDARCIGRKKERPKYLNRTIGIDYEERYQRFRQSLHSGLPLPSLPEFAGQSKDILNRLATQPSLAPLLHGLCLPLVVPQLEIADYGCYLESVFLGSLRHAYKQQYPKHEFDQGLTPLGMDLRVHAAGRHGRLIRVMAKQAIVGVFFPWAFHGIAPAACRDAMQQLPPNFLLAGGIDTALAFIGYPDVLAPNKQSADLAAPGIQYLTDRRAMVYQCWGQALRVSDHHGTWEVGADVSSGLFVTREEIG